MSRKLNCHIFVTSDLDKIAENSHLRHSYLKFAPLFLLVPRYVSIKLEVSTAFPFPEKSDTQNRQNDRWTDRHTDGGATHDATL